MQASTPIITEIFNSNTLLRIPYFQRRYVWEEKDWQRFAVDMESTLYSDRKYFLGAIILKDEGTNMEERMRGIARKLLVIDGQQRLTTLAIYMKVLHMMVGRNELFCSQYLQDNGSKDPIVIHSSEDRKDFEKIMHLSTPQILNGGNNVIKAYNYFLSFLQDTKNQGEVSLNALLNMVNSNVTFVSISLDYKDDEQQIFDTINSLGVPLTTDELLKNFLYEEKDEQAYRDNWRIMFDTNEASDFWGTDAAKSRQAKTNATKTIERFLHAFVRIKMWDFKDQLDEMQRKNFVKSENVFSTCKAFVEIFHTSKQDLANEIIAYAKLFKEHLGDKVLSIRIPQHVGIKRLSCLINATQSYAVVPYVLYILKNVSDESERNLIFGYLESYLVRRIIAGSKSNNYSDLFSENLIGQRINTYEDLKSYISDKDEESSLAMPKNSKVVYGLNNRRFDETTARIVFYLYETKLTKTSTQTFSGGYSRYYAEQLMPSPGKATEQTWPACEDPIDEENRKQLIKTLGNYFLLDDVDDKILKKAHNDVFEDKKSILIRWTKGIRSSEIMDDATKKEKFQKWDVMTITNRNNTFARIINDNIWKGE